MAGPRGQAFATGPDQHPAVAGAQLECSGDVSHGTTVRTGWDFRSALAGVMIMKSSGVMVDLTSPAV
jgi:hypothetical protein